MRFALFTSSTGQTYFLSLNLMYLWFTSLLLGLCSHLLWFQLQRLRVLSWCTFVFSFLVSNIHCDCSWSMWNSAFSKYNFFRHIPLRPVAIIIIVIKLLFIIAQCTLVLHSPLSPFLFPCAYGEIWDNISGWLWLDWPLTSTFFQLSSCHWNGTETLL